MGACSVAPWVIGGLGDTTPRPPPRAHTADYKPTHAPPPIKQWVWFDVVGPWSRPGQESFNTLTRLRF